jgi:hypothetical protein
MEPEEAKEIYAHFGLAFYISNVLEHGIVNALLFLDTFQDPQRCTNREQWENLIDKHFDDSFKMTLGQLKKRLVIHKDKFSQLDAIVPELEKCLLERNFLAHHFYREYAQHWFSSNGRAEMVERLEAAREFFHATDRKLEAIIQPLMGKYGFTDEVFEKFYAEMLTEAENY